MLSVSSSSLPQPIGVCEDMVCRRNASTKQGLKLRSEEAHLHMPKVSTIGYMTYVRTVDPQVAFAGLPWGVRKVRTCYRVVIANDEVSGCRSCKVHQIGIPKHSRRMLGRTVLQPKVQIVSTMVMTYVPRYCTRPAILNCDVAIQDRQIVDNSKQSRLSDGLASVAASS